MELRTRDRSASSGTVAGAGAIALWSFSGVCYGVGGRTLGAMPFLAMSSAIGVLTIVVLHLVRGLPVLALFRLPARVMIAGIFGIVVYSLLLGTATEMAAERDVVQVMLLNYLWPIWIALLSIGLLKERVRAPLVLVGAALGFGGVVMAHGGGMRGYSAASLVPHAMATVGGVMWAMYSVVLRRWKVPAEQGGSTFQFLVLALAAAAIGAGQGAWRPVTQWEARGVFFTVFAGIGPVGLGYYWWEIGMKRGSVHLLAVLSNFIPIASAVLMVIFFRASWNGFLLPGAGMIALGAWVGQGAGEAPGGSARSGLRGGEVG